MLAKSEGKTSFFVALYISTYKSGTFNMVMRLKAKKQSVVPATAFDVITVSKLQNSNRVCKRAKYIYWVKKKTGLGVLKKRRT